MLIYKENVLANWLFKNSNRGCYWEQVVLLFQRMHLAKQLGFQKMAKDLFLVEYRKCSLQIQMQHVIFPKTSLI